MGLIVKENRAPASVCVRKTERRGLHSSSSGEKIQCRFVNNAMNLRLHNTQGLSRSHTNRHKISINKIEVRQDILRSDWHFRDNKTRT